MKETLECGESNLKSSAHESLSILLREIQAMKMVLGQLVGDMPAKSDLLSGTIGTSQYSCRLCRPNTSSIPSQQGEDGEGWLSLIDTLADSLHESQHP